MTDASGFRGYSLLIVTSSMHIPSSGYYEIRDVASALTYQLQVYGRGLPLARVTKIAYELTVWAEDSAKPWTCRHEDAEITVRLTEKFIGWGPDMRPL
jgi:hypothetical protein